VKPLVVASYNIHGAVGIDRRRAPERIAEILISMQADVIALQEVDSHDHPNGFLRQVDYFAEATGMHVIAGPTVTCGQRDYGNAILTRLPVQSARRIPISIDRCEPRVVVEAVLGTPPFMVTVLATHFGLTNGERRQQVERVAELIRDNHDARLIVLGDFNEWRWRDGVLGPIVAQTAPQAPLATFPSWLPVFPLDRIFARPPVRIVSIGVVRGLTVRRASDHLPIRALVAL
jgi:endonuclease/exonuclease/phosphatase family metal-dependent hydrolase